MEMDVGIIRNAEEAIGAFGLTVLWLCSAASQRIRVMRPSYDELDAYGEVSRSQTQVAHTNFFSSHD